MAAVTVRNLSDQTHRALKLRAAKNGRSTEAEIRLILDAAITADQAVKPKKPTKLGTELAAFARRFGGFELKPSRLSQDMEPVSFE